MRTIEGLATKYKLSTKLKDMRGSTIDIDVSKEVCDGDKWLVVNFLRYNEGVHSKTINKGYGSSDTTIYNNYCQEVLSEEMKKIKPIPEDYIEIGFYKLCHYFPKKIRD